MTIVRCMFYTYNIAYVWFSKYKLRWQTRGRQETTWAHNIDILRVITKVRKVV